MPQSLRKNIPVLTFTCIWIAIFSEYALYLTNSKTGVFASIVHLTLFFTILANLLAGASVAAFLFPDKVPFANLLRSEKFATAALSYITIVGIVYNVLIRGTWNPQGAEIWIQELLHVVNPILFLLYWIFFVDGKKLQYRDAILFLVFPFFYLTITFVRGAITNFYPYWFLDLPNQGWIVVASYSFILFLIFLFFGILYVLIGKKKN